MSNKRPKKRSKVWEHYNERPDGQKATCKYCKNELSANSKGGTSHLKRHLDTCKDHPNRVVNQPPTVVSSNETANIGLTWDNTPEGIVKKAITEEIPFASSECRKLWHNMIGPMDIEREIFAYYERAKEKLAIELKDLPSLVSFSFEIIKKLCYISITAHFINGDFILTRKLIGFKKLTNVYSESCIADAIGCCISDWKLGDKIFTIIGGHNPYYIRKRLLQKFSSVVLDDTGIHFRCCKAQVNQLYCKCISHLCRQEDSNIDKFVKHVKEFPTGMAIFNKIAGEKGLPPISINWLNEYAECSWDVHSKDLEHWKPAVQKFKKALIYEYVFDEYAKIAAQVIIVLQGSSGLDNEDSGLSDNINVSCLSALVQAGQLTLSELNVGHIDWTDVEDAVDCSQFFLDTIDGLCTSDLLPSNLYIPKMAILYDKRPPFDLIDFVFIDHSRSLFLIANALDPRYKLIFWEYHETLCDPEYCCEDDEHIDFLKYIFIKYEEMEMIEASPTCVEFTNTQNQSTSSYSAYLSTETISGFSKYVKETKKKKSELDKYLDEELVDLVDPAFDPLDWWKQNRLRYPILYKMARDVLAVPTCAYSIEDKISSDFKALEGASPELVEAVMCSKDWILSDAQRMPESNN